MARRGQPRRHQDLEHLSPEEYRAEADRRYRAKCNAERGFKPAPPTPRKYPDLEHLSPTEYAKEAGRRNAKAKYEALPKEQRTAQGQSVQYNPDTHRQRTYGLTPDQYAALLTSQDGVCAICRRADKLFVDHCHDTGAVRGLLCRKCNTGLGMFLDSSTLLAAAGAYLGT